MNEQAMTFPLRDAIKPWPYKHSEAFCLMQYATECRSEVEWIWNSRDGVTPFIVSSRSGREMHHVCWHMDRYAPTYKPQPGERIFVDVTEEIARGWAQAQVTRYWDHEMYPMSRRFASKEEAIAYLTNDYLSPHGNPALIEVAS